MQSPDKIRLDDRSDGNLKERGNQRPLELCLSFNARIFTSDESSKFFPEFSILAGEPRLLAQFSDSIPYYGTSERSEPLKHSFRFGRMLRAAAGLSAYFGRLTICLARAIQEPR
jgi:hypothetical protein